MGYVLKIGKATLSVTYSGSGQYITPTVEPCPGDAPHPKGGVLLPSCTAWADFLGRHPLVEDLWTAIEGEYKADSAEFECFYPLSRISDYLLQRIADDVHWQPKASTLEEVEDAGRVDWLIWAIRESKLLYGELAALEVPGEWG